MQKEEILKGVCDKKVRQKEHLIKRSMRPAINMERKSD